MIIKNDSQEYRFSYVEREYFSFEDWRQFEIFRLMAWEMLMTSSPKTLIAEKWTKIFMKNKIEAYFY
jgi:hypothetical protein